MWGMHCPYDGRLMPGESTVGLLLYRGQRGYHESISVDVCHINSISLVKPAKLVWFDEK